MYPPSAENTFYQQYLVQPEDYDNYSLPHWIGFEHLAQGRTYLKGFATDLAPYYAEYLAGNGSCYIQEERPCKSIGIGCSSTPDETLISMDAHQEHEKLTGNNSKNTQYDISNWEYQKQATNASKDNVAQHQSNMSASTSTSGTGTKSRKRYSKEKAKDADRRRRIRIAAAIDSLESSLPLSHGGNKTDIVDKCVDYIKSLQHHLKELSQNRLGGEPTSNHMMHLEEYGHFLVNESTTSGPLDDIIGKLLDENPSEAAMLLKTRSFYDAYCS